jgi:HD-like signal output (HDOD) protein
MRRQQNPSADFSRFAGDFNRHNHATALIARRLALHLSPDLCDTVYSAGLLHSIGTFAAVLSLSENEQYESFQDNSDAFIKDSNTIAELILTQWNLPDPIIRAAADFINPLERTSDQHNLTAMVHAACGLSCLLGRCFGEKICVDEISPHILSQVGLPENLEVILPAVFDDLKAAGLVGARA